MILNDADLEKLYILVELNKSKYSKEEIKEKIIFWACRLNNKEHIHEAPWNILKKQKNFIINQLNSIVDTKQNLENEFLEVLNDLAASKTNFNDNDIFWSYKRKFNKTFKVDNFKKDIKKLIKDNVKKNNMPHNYLSNLKILKEIKKESGIRICSKCGFEGKEYLFYACNTCRECRKKYYRERRKRIIEENKYVVKKCTKCGFEGYYNMFQFASNICKKCFSTHYKNYYLQKKSNNRPY